MSVKILWGDEEYNLQKAVLKLREQLVDESWASISHKILDEPDIKILIETLQTLPMAFGNLLIEVKANTYFLRGQRKAFDDDLIKELISTLESLNDNIYVVFICNIPRESGKKVDSTIKLSKAISKLGDIQEFTAYKYYETEKVINWIIKTSKSYGYSISNQSASLLLENTGNDLRKLDSEISKLSLIADNKEISINNVKDLTSTHENIFLVADYWLNNQKSNSIIELNKLFEKNHPLRILSVLNTTIRKWFKLKLESQSKSNDEIAKNMKMHPYVVKKELEKIREISIDTLSDYRNKLTNAETSIKSGELLPELALEMIIST